MFQHPKFQIIPLQPNGSYADYDFGLVQLNSPAILRYTTKLICLPFGNQQFVGKKLTVSGWGTTDPVKLTAPSVLMSADVTGFLSEKCAKIVPPVYAIKPNIHLCAGIGEGRGTLGGDSGGNRCLNCLFTFNFSFASQLQMHLLEEPDQDTLL